MSIKSQVVKLLSQFNTDFKKSKFMKLVPENEEIKQN